MTAKYYQEKTHEKEDSRRNQMFRQIVCTHRQWVEMMRQSQNQKFETGVFPPHNDVDLSPTRSSPRSSPHRAPSFAAGHKAALPFSLVASSPPSDQTEYRKHL